MNPPPTYLPTTSLWVIPMHQPQACCTLRQTWWEPSSVVRNSIFWRCTIAQVFFGECIKTEILTTGHLEDMWKKTGHSRGDLVTVLRRVDSSWAWIFVPSVSHLGLWVTWEQEPSNVPLFTAQHRPWAQILSVLLTRSPLRQSRPTLWL